MLSIDPPLLSDHDFVVADCVSPPPLSNLAFALFVTGARSTSMHSR